MFITGQLYHGECEEISCLFYVKQTPSSQEVTFPYRFDLFLGPEGKKMMFHFPSSQIITLFTEHNIAVLYSKSQRMAFFQLNLFSVALITNRNLISQVIS